MTVYSDDYWQKKQLTFKRAYELAIAQETAKKNTAELKQKEAMSTPGNPKGVSIHQLQKRVPKASNRPTDRISGCCYRCGKQGHKQFECWFKNVMFRLWQNWACEGCLLHNKKNGSERGQW